MGFYYKIPMFVKYKCLIHRHYFLWQYSLH